MNFYDELVRLRKEGPDAVVIEVVPYEEHSPSVAERMGVTPEVVFVLSDGSTVATPRKWMFLAWEMHRLDIVGVSTIGPQPDTDQPAKHYFGKVTRRLLAVMFELDIDHRFVPISFPRSAGKGRRTLNAVDPEDAAYISRLAEAGYQAELEAAAMVDKTES